MSEKLFISGPLPPSLNNAYYTGRDGRRHLTKEAKTYKENIAETLMVNNARSMCPEPPFSVHLHLRFKDKRRTDVSNRVKILEDAVFGYLGHDDSLVYDLHIWRYIDRSKPGMSMEIRHCSRDLEV